MTTSEQKRCQNILNGLSTYFQEENITPNMALFYLTVYKAHIASAMIINNKKEKNEMIYLLEEDHKLMLATIDEYTGLNGHTIN